MEELNTKSFVNLSIFLSKIKVDLKNVLTRRVEIELGVKT